MKTELIPERDGDEKAKCGNCRFWNTDGQAGDGVTAKLKSPTRCRTAKKYLTP